MSDIYFTAEGSEEILFDVANGSTVELHIGEQPAPIEFDVQGGMGPAGKDGAPGADGLPGTTDYTQLENLPNLTVYAEKTNVLEKNGTTVWTPDGDYQPATKKYVDDHAPDFLSLTDAPDSYSGQAGKVVSVNPAETGLEFSSISGLGDMKASVYDPTGVASDAFDTDNHVSGTTNKVFTVTEQTKLSGIAAGAEVNVQADWNAASGDAAILNKPTIPSGLTPSTTVVSETSYGQAAVVGVSTNYAREDHTHGTPAGGSGISEAQAIAFSCALGGI